MSTSVFYFGGYKASQNDIDSWLRSAKQQKPSIDFCGFPWPKDTVSYPGDKVVEGAKKAGLLQLAIGAIDACKSDAIYVVGHSSGCAIANAVDKGLKSTDNVVLVDLDGYSADAEQLKRTTTQVWGAECDGKLSRNYPGSAGGRRNVHHPKHCKKEWALHFSLVNAAASDSLVSGVSDGYAHCQANLMWL